MSYAAVGAEYVDDVYEEDGCPPKYERKFQGGEWVCLPETWTPVKTPPPLPAPPVTTTATTKAGVGVGAVALAALAVGAGIFFVSRKKR